MFTADQYSDLRRMIERNEGRKHQPYRDQVGKLTIGVGRNLDDTGVTDQEIDFLLHNDVEDALLFLNSYPWYSKIDPVRQMALVDMMFTLGPMGFAKFKAMLTALAASNYALAADAVLDSLWAQEASSRAYRDARLLRTGEMP